MKIYLIMEDFLGDRFVHSIYSSEKKAMRQARKLQRLSYTDDEVTEYFVKEMEIID